MHGENSFDASVQLGEMTKAIPQTNSNQHIARAQSDNAVQLQKTKTETVRDLGFTPKQREVFRLTKRWAEYERRKKELERLGLSPGEYEKAIRALVRELKL